MWNYFVIFYFMTHINCEYIIYLLILCPVGFTQIYVKLLCHILYDCTTLVLTRWTSQPIKMWKSQTKLTYDVTFLRVLEKIVYKIWKKKKYIEIDVTICFEDCQLQGKWFAWKECNNAWAGIQLLCLPL